jgi:hypothetical protein
VGDASPKLALVGDAGPKLALVGDVGEFEAWPLQAAANRHTPRTISRIGNSLSLKETTRINGRGLMPAHGLGDEHNSGYLPPLGAHPADRVIPVLDRKGENSGRKLERTWNRAQNLRLEAAARVAGVE